MSSCVTVDIFVEDRAHEAFLVPMLQRIAREENVEVSVRVRSARGGHPRAVAELRLYQDLARKGTAVATAPDLVVAGIDGNCLTFAKARKVIEDATHQAFSGRLIAACPDPHIERWFLADPDSFKAVVGHRPTLGRKKCVRDHYKQLLAKAVQQGGHPPTLGGVEFAAELVQEMNLYRAGRNDRSLKALIDDLRSGMRKLRLGH